MAQHPKRKWQVDHKCTGNQKDNNKQRKTDVLPDDAACLLAQIQRVGDKFQLIECWQLSSTKADRLRGCWKRLLELGALLTHGH